MRPLGRAGKEEEEIGEQKTTWDECGNASTARQMPRINDLPHGIEAKLVAGNRVLGDKFSYLSTVGSQLDHSGIVQ